MKNSNLLFLMLATCLLANGVAVVRAAVSDADQQSLHSQYVGKVLLFRKCGRMVNQYDVQEDGTVNGKAQPGFWSVDGAVQVKDIEFRKDRVTFKCIKLWANIKDDGQLHFFPASAALKGKSSDYPQTTDIIFRTSQGNVAAAEIVARLAKVCLGEHESMLGTAPQSIAAFVQRVQEPVDIGPNSGGGFKGTPPKLISNPIPSESREAQLVSQAGKESFVVYVDEEGRVAVVGFTHLLQYGLEEATIEAVKGWKFEPATQDGKPVAVRMAMSIDYKLPDKR
jgi:Gram-negative bacterial TonB protein C-terminal